MGLMLAVLTPIYVQAQRLEFQNKEFEFETGESELAALENLLKTLDELGTANTKKSQPQSASEMFVGLRPWMIATCVAVLGYRLNAVNHIQRTLGYR